MNNLHPTLSLSNLEDHMVPVEGGIMEIQWVNIQLDDFALCRFQVSQQLWKDVLGRYPKETHFQNPTRPAEMISWNDIQDTFLPALREQTGNDSWCLPTEAQWEYAARGGKYAKTYFYAGSEGAKELGWYAVSSSRETNPIGCKRPNILGLFDMLGNVEEWCQDNCNRNYYQQLKDRYGDQPIPNLIGPRNERDRAARGASFGFNSVTPRFLDCTSFEPSYRYFDVGFRLCQYSAR